MASEPALGEAAVTAGQRASTTVAISDDDKSCEIPLIDRIVEAEAMPPDGYNILGVGRGATEAEIKQAYRKSNPFL